MRVCLLQKGQVFDLNGTSSLIATWESAKKKKERERERQRERERDSAQSYCHACACMCVRVCVCGWGGYEGGERTAKKGILAILHRVI